MTDTHDPASATATATATGSGEGDDRVPDGGSQGRSEDDETDGDARRYEPTPAGARGVLAQGTFDILHPGHVHYLREAATMGDHLTVVVARSTNVTHKPDPVVGADQRRRMVAALDPVDRAVLGHPEDIFVPVEAVDPDVIALGYDQHHEEDAVADALAERGLDCEVCRVSARPEREGEITSTSAIVARVLAERGDGDTDAAADHDHDHDS